MRVAVAGGTGTVGRHVVEALRAGGHTPVVLSRSAGVDLTSGDGLADALVGAGAVVDVTSTATSSAADSVRFFTTVTGHLLRAGAQAGVAHHVVLSIVGAAAVGAGYYAGKKAQEEMVAEEVDGDAGRDWTVLRTTQFHEFAAQIARRGRRGPVTVVPTMVSQPVAASEVGAELAGIATGAPRGLDTELAGPRVENMADLVRRLTAASGRRRPVLQVPLPGAWGRSLRDGSLLPGAGARRGRATFDDWLRGAGVGGTAQR